MRTKELHRLKEIEYYAATVAAWYNTSLEHDKSLFTLSVGAIGVLATLLTTLGVKNPVLLAFYSIAMVAFLSCIIVLLVIFRLNRNHLELVISGNVSGLDLCLKWLDFSAICAFGVGAVFAVLIGVFNGLNSLHSDATKEKEMGIEKIINEPVDPMMKSFSGSGGLSPKPIQSTSAPSAPSRPAPISIKPAKANSDVKK